MRGELSAIADSMVARITEHPFWDCLRRGTLPAASLWYFAEQDAHHVVPTYARALARCAALAGSDAHGTLLVSAASATFGSLTRVNDDLGELAAVSGQNPDTVVPPGPEVHAYTSFMLAAPACSFATGIGGLLPMTWFHLLVSDDLRKRYDPGSRHAAWIERYLPVGDYLQGYVDAYLTMVDEVSAGYGAGERDLLVEGFRLGARHEWSFADSAYRCLSWPV